MKKTMTVTFTISATNETETITFMENANHESLTKSFEQSYENGEFSELKIEYKYSK